MKKLACLLLASVLLFGAFACGETAVNPTDPQSQQPGETESRKLSIGIMSNINVTDYEDNEFTKYLEEKANVELSFVFFPSSSDNALRQIALTAASQKEKLPDLLLGFSGLQPNARNEYGSSGYFLDLNEYMEYAPNYQAALAKLTEEERTRIVSRGTAEDGCFYAMPNYFMSVVDDMQSLMYINQAWLDAVNMSAPTTIEELYQVCVAFRDKDPNGNGINDEIPMCSMQSSGILDYIINAFVYFDSSYMFNVDNGKVYPSFATNEYREAMKFMNKMCREGLLSDLCFSLSSTNEAISLNTPADGTAVVGIWCGHPDVVTLRTSPLLSEYTALSYLGDATGKGGYNVISPSTLQWGGIITKDCAYPKVAMELMDVFYLDETSSRQRHGVPGVDWYDEEGTSLFGGKAHINLINSDVFFKGNHTWCKNVLGMANAWNYLYCDRAETEVERQENRLLGGACEIYAKKNMPAEVCTDVIYTAEQYEQKNEFAAMINSAVTEYRGYFIKGSLDPNNDADWQKYIEVLDRYQISDYTELMQEVYNENK